MSWNSSTRRCRIPSAIAIAASFGRPSSPVEDALCDLGHFNEVHRAGFGKYDFEFSHSLAKQRETRANDVPIFLGVTRRRECAEVAERGFEAVDVSQVGDQLGEASLLERTIWGKAMRLVDLNAKGAFLCEHKVGEAEKCALAVVQRFFALPWSGGKFRKFGELLVMCAFALFTSEARQFQSFIARAWYLVEEPVDLSDCLRKGFRKRPLQAVAQSFRIRLLLEHKVVHPSIPLLEHFNEQSLELGPVVVPPKQQVADCVAQGGVASADFVQGSARCAPVELGRSLINSQVGAEVREQWLLDRQFTTKRVDGRDAQIGGEILKLPAERP